MFDPGVRTQVGRGKHNFHAIVHEGRLGHFPPAVEHDCDAVAHYIGPPLDGTE
jgi:hypothetical protein